MSELETSLPPPKRQKLTENEDGDIKLPTEQDLMKENLPELASFDGWSRELECGVTAFLNPDTPSFSCIFKHRLTINLILNLARFSDFIVNEITMEGKVVTLNKLKPDADVLPKAPEPEVEEVSTEDPEIKAIKASQALLEIMNRENAANGEEEAKKVMEFAAKFSAPKESGSAPPSEELLIAIGEKSKTWRGDFHKLIRENFPHLRSETVQREQTSFIRIWCGTDKYDKKKNSRPVNPSRYVEMVMYKENKDTTDAIHLISKFLGIRTGMIRFAGTKDKRGLTFQNITMPYTDPMRLFHLNQKIFGVKLGNFALSEKHLHLGDLNGNKFQVILRDIKTSPLKHPSYDSNMPVQSFDAENDEAIIQTCERFAKTGFINYYGMQRFGTGTVRTHFVGKECLKGNWKEVINLILKPRAGDRADVAEARASYERTKDPRETLKILPKFMLNERLILQALQNNPTDFKGALDKLSRPMRLMFAHAYQSYIWNAAASKRIELYGHKVVVGDIVAADTLSLDQISKDMVVDEVEAIGSAEDAEVDANADLAKSASKLSFKVIETEEEASQYSLEQVVIPLPGPSVMIPQNEVGTYMKELLEADGLDFSFSKEREFHLTGAYRSLCVKPIDFEYKIIRYDDDDCDLILSDYDILAQDSSTRGKPKVVGVNPNGSKRALHLVFSLPSSAYASCLVRELAKQPLDQGFLRDQKAK